MRMVIHAGLLTTKTEEIIRWLVLQTALPPC
jgi:hypothetical protein